MSETNVTRRGFFGHTAGAFTLVSVASVGAVIVSDPMASFLARWEHLINAVEAGQTGPVEEQWHSVERQVRDGDLPIPTTPQGAAASLRKALAFGDMEQQDASLVRSALAYLEQQAA